MGVALKASGRAAAGITVGGLDLTGGSIASSVTETTLGSVTIPANTFKSYMFVIADIDVDTHSNNTGLFKVKVGASGSEAEKYQIQLNAIQVTDLVYKKDNRRTIMVPLDAEAWTTELSVILTAQNGQNGPTEISYCHTVIVLGQ
jgi:hypothetical protein